MSKIKSLLHCFSRCIWHLGGWFTSRKYYGDCGSGDKEGESIGYKTDGKMGLSNYTRVERKSMFIFDYIWVKFYFQLTFYSKYLTTFFVVVVIGELLNMQSLKVLEENRKKKKKTNIAKFRFQLRKLILGANCRTHASWVSIHWRQVNWPGI